jgi:hypothetical protein
MDTNAKYKLLLKYSKDLYSVRTFSNDGFPFDLSIFKDWRKARNFYKKLSLEPAPDQIIFEYKKYDTSGKPLKP